MSLQFVPEKGGILKGRPVAAVVFCAEKFGGGHCRLGVNGGDVALEVPDEPILWVCVAG